MELRHHEIILACTIEKVHRFHIGFAEKRPDVVMFFGDSAVESGNLAADC